MTAKRERLKLGILASGRGTNLQAILNAIDAGSLAADARLVITNKPGALAADRAIDAGVPHQLLNHRDYENRLAFDAALVRALRAVGAEWVVLAGFMRLLTPVFIDAFAGRTINIHPSLLPAFPGVNAQKQAVDYGVRLTGCTVHFVDKGTDTGPIIAQRAIEVRQADDPDSLAARLLPVENDLLVDVLRWIAAGRVGLHDRRVTISAESPE